MSPAHHRYVVNEAAIGAAISAVLSVVFVLLMFGGQARIPIAGAGGLIVDAVPQGAAIAFMATLVPTLLTRQRLARGAVAPLRGSPSSGPAHPLVRALAMAALGAGITAGLTAMMLVGDLQDLAFVPVLVGKAVWGLFLGGGVAATMTRAALVRD